MSVLPVASRLLLVLVFDRRRDAYRLLVCDLGGLQEDLNSELSLDLLGGDIDVRVPEPSKEHLQRVRLPVEGDARVLLHDAGQGAGHLVDVRLRLGIDGHPVNGVGELHTVHDERIVPLAEGVARQH